jgi:putative DNA primase/helicase
VSASPNLNITAADEAFVGLQTTPEPYTDIPQQLKDLPNWVNWKLDKQHGKVPYNAKNGRKAKSNDPSTWATFDRAVAAAADGLNDYDGIGFMLHGTLLAGADLDGMLHAGVAEPFALEILKHLGNPYCETSPSGNGLHAFIECPVLPAGGRKLSKNKYGAEIYHGGEGGRYLTVTGARFSGDGIPKIG